MTRVATRIDVSLNGTAHEASVRPLDAARYEVSTRESVPPVREVHVLRRGPDALLLVGDRVVALSLGGESAGQRAAALRGQTHAVQLGHTKRVVAARGATTKASHTLTAPMPGRVVAIKVAPGDSVEPGQVLLVIEAMKMQNEMFADGAGTVDAVLVQLGAAVERGALLMRLR